MGRNLKKHSIDRAKSFGWIVADVEHTDRRRGQKPVTRDLFGWMDLMAYDPAGDIWYGIQVMSAAHRAAHIKKFAEDRETKNALIAWAKNPNHRAVAWEYPRPGSNRRMIEIDLADAVRDLGYPYGRKDRDGT